MKAEKLYKQLDFDFELDSCKDDWAAMDYNEFISENFKNRYMGILLDNSVEIDSIYTAVFPSNKVLNQILELNKENILLFTHHAMTWDIRKTEVFQNIDPELLLKLKHKKTSIYTLHVPLDKNGKYGTTSNLAKALEITPEGEFYEYFGVRVGVIGRTELNTPEELANKLSTVVGHKIKLWKYGSDDIIEDRVALVAGGGNTLEGIEQIIELGINTYVTGITAHNEFSKEVHDFEKKHEINIIGGTHYSTEKFACISMCKYFEHLALNCQFLEDTPVLEDLE